MNFRGFGCLARCLAPGGRAREHGCTHRCSLAWPGPGSTRGRSSNQKMLAQIYIALWIAFVVYIYRWNQRRLVRDAGSTSWLPPNEARGKYLELIEKYGDDVDTNPTFKKECMEALIQRALIDLQVSLRAWKCLFMCSKRTSCRGKKRRCST